MTNLEFGNLFTFIRNGKNVRQQADADGIPISRIETISQGVVDPLRVGFAGLDEESARGWLLEEGDILFSHINSVEHVGKCAIYQGAPSKLVHGMNLLCLRPDPSKIVPSFAVKLIRTPQFRGKLSNFINKAVNQASVSTTNLKGIRVSVPPMEQQRRIAAILDQAEALRTKRRQALQRVAALGRSVFIELFGHPARNDRNFKMEQMDRLCERITVGFVGQMSTEYVASGVPLLRSLNIKRGLIDRSDLKYVSDQFHRKLLKSRLSPGDVVAVRTGKPGVSAVIPDDFGETNCADLIVMTCGKDLEPAYLCEYLNVRLGDADSIQGQVGAIQVHFNIGSVKALSIPVPPNNLQRQFSHIHRKIAESERRLVRAVEESNKLFASLQHRAFRGEL
jgi:type I restriction enzyme, S subunit